MNKILYITFIVFILSSCSAITRPPANDVAKDLLDKGTITDPSGDVMMPSEETPVTYIDCKDYVAEEVVQPEEAQIEVVQTRTLSKLAMGLMEQPLTADMMVVTNVCQLNCNNDGIVDCSDVACTSSRGNMDYLIDALAKINVTCESESAADTEEPIAVEVVKPILQIDPIEVRR